MSARYLLLLILIPLLQPAIIRDPELVRASNEFRESWIRENEIFQERIQGFTDAYNKCLPSIYSNQYDLSCLQVLSLYSEMEGATKTRMRKWKKLESRLKVRK